MILLFVFTRSWARICEVQLSGLCAWNNWHAFLLVCFVKYSFLKDVILPEKVLQLIKCVMTFCPQPGKCILCRPSSSNKNIYCFQENCSQEEKFNLCGFRTWFWIQLTCGHSSFSWNYSGLFKFSQFFSLGSMSCNISSS